MYPSPLSPPLPCLPTPPNPIPSTQKESQVSGRGTRCPPATGPLFDVIIESCSPGSSGPIGTQQSRAGQGLGESGEPGETRQVYKYAVTSLTRTTSHWGLLRRRSYRSGPIAMWGNEQRHKPYHREQTGP